MSKPGSTEENLQVVRTAIEAYNAHGVARAIDCEGESVIHFSPPHPKGLQGRESAMSTLKDDFMAFPDIQFKVDQMMGEGNWVIVH